MPTTMNVTKTLRRALANLKSERDRITRQIAALETAIGVDETGRRGGAARTEAKRRGRRKRMSATARKAASQRMKAYWAKRRAQAARLGKKAAK